jgi:dTDP-4-dehydrorhamnose 3,5-epimerase
MKIEETSLPGVLLVYPDVFGDHRGYFQESWNRRKFSELGLNLDFVQDNLSLSKKGILRGLHFQNPNQQGKLVQALQGEVFDVAVDIRKGSPNFGQWFGAILSADNHLNMYIPEGFAHGFCVLSESALFAYKCTDFYNPATEYSLRYDDPDIGVEWPLECPPSLSAKDVNAVSLKDFPEESLPLYKPS